MPPRKYKFFKKFIQDNSGGTCTCNNPNVLDNDRINSCLVVCDKGHQFNISTLDLKNGKWWCDTCLEEQGEQKQKQEDQLYITKLKSTGQDALNDPASLVDYMKDFRHYNANIKQRCTQAQIDEITDIDTQVNAAYGLNNPTNRLLVFILKKMDDIEDRINNVETSISDIEYHRDNERHHNNNGWN